MNISIWQQLALVLAGGLVAIVGGLSSAWFTARLTAGRQRRDLLHRLHELSGRQQAIVTNSAGGASKPVAPRTTEALFGRSNPSPEQVAFMIGFLEKISAQTEGYMRDSNALEIKIIEAKTKNAFLEEQLAEKKAEVRSLGGQRAAWQPGDRVACLLHRGETDIYYPGTALDADRVQLDDYPCGESIVSLAGIADWHSTA